jgi:hypothetical protein
MSGGGCQYPLTLAARARDGVQAHACSGRAVMFDGGCAATPPLPYLPTVGARLLRLNRVCHDGVDEDTEWD